MPDSKRTKAEEFKRDIAKIVRKKEREYMQAQIKAMIAAMPEPPRQSNEGAADDRA